MHLDFFRHVTPKGFRVRSTGQTSSIHSIQIASAANHYEYSGSVLAVCRACSVQAQHAERMLSMHVQVILQGSVSIAKRNVRYPRTIGFRVTDETWFAIQREISNTDLTPHDWCRMVVLDSLNRGFGLTKKEHIFFQQAAAIRYLVANGFQLLADDRLTTEEWKKPACCPKNRSM